MTDHHHENNVKDANVVVVSSAIDKTNPEIFFTYSYWENKQDLENYRNSELFKDVWAKTKVFFNDKPLAWSVDKRVSLN